MAESQPDNTGGCMLALYPPKAVAAALALPGGLPRAELHLTVCYAGDAADVEPEALKAVARKLAQRGPVAASISGHARFTGGDTDVIVALADGAALEDLRRDAMDLLGAQGIAVPRDHGYTPHLTIRYADPADADPVGRLKATPLAFTGISVVHGKERTDYPFADDLAERARSAYSAGWALSGGPMTEAVRAGCAAVMEMAREHPDDPAILEVSLDLGKLQGTWAEVYRRREDLTATHARKVAKVWRKLVKRLDPDQLVARYRRDLLMIEAAPDGKPDDRQKAAARASVLWWLSEITSDPEFRDLPQAVTEALAAGLAEGKTAALAIAADQASRLGFDWATAYARMYAGLTNLSSLPGMSATWVQDILGAAAADAGRALAVAAAAGKSDAEMIAAVLGEAGGADPEAVALMVDYAMGGSFARGALDLYMSEGLTLVAWLTAGDGRVCFSCQDNEDQGPYDPSAFPACPDHPRCVIGSTRVTVPGPGVVATDVRRDLSGAGVDPPAGGATASAAAGAGFDFGRVNIRAVSDREYVGDVVTIRTALGHELTATPNHPVATGGGWVPIAELAVGDHVLASTRPEWVAEGVDPDVDDVPPCIEQVAESFAVQLGPMPTAPEDFHGDGADSKVHVVRSDRLLVDDGHAGVAEHACEHQLSRRRIPVRRALPLNPDGPGNEELGSLRLTANRVVGGTGEPGALLGAGLGHAQVHGLASPPRLNVGVKQAIADDGAVSPERVSEGLLALAGQVARDDRRAVDRNLPLTPASSLGPHVDTGLPESLADGTGAGPEGFREGIAALAGDVAADELVHVERHAFSGHVYNLDTSAGWYIGNGIITHNCRCTPTPASPLPVSAFADFLILPG